MRAPQQREQSGGASRGPLGALLPDRAGKCAAARMRAGRGGAGSRLGATRRFGAVRALQWRMRLPSAMPYPLPSA